MEGKDMEQNKKNNQIQVIMGIYSITALVFFIIFALTRDGFGPAVKGFFTVLTMPAQMTLDYFKYATVAGTFLNVGLVGLSCMAVLKISGAKLSGVTLIAYFLTIGFAFFGMNMVNIWPCILGTLLFTVVTHVPFAAEANIAIFSTALAPFVSELFFRYTPFEGKPVLRLICGIAVGLFAGFLMPIYCKHGPNIHKGHSLYNAATGACLIALFLYALLFKAVGVEGPTNTDLGDSIPLAVNSYAVVTGVLSIVIGFFLNGHSLKNAFDVFKKTGYGSDLTAERPALAMFNIGFYSLFMTLYYNLIGSSMTGPTLAAIVCTTSCAAMGAHILNMVPIILGYAIASSFCVFSLNTQAIILGLCFAVALTPIAGGYGPLAGIIAGFIHAIMVTQVVTYYNAFTFYNGGVTCFFTAIILGTVLEYFFEKDTKYHWNPVPLKKKK